MTTINVTLNLSAENEELMKRFCDSIDLLKASSQLTARQSAPAQPAPAMTPAVSQAAVTPTFTAPPQQYATSAPQAFTPPRAPSSPRIFTPTCAGSPAAPATTYTAPTATPGNQAPTAAAPTYTQDQLARATATLADAGRMQQIQQLFQQFGIQQLTALPKERYGDYATALRQMGVRI